MNFVPLTTITNQTFLITPRNAGQVVRVGAQEIITEAGVPVRVYGSGTVELSEGWWDQAGVFDGNYTGPYIDGGTKPGGMLKRTRWLGTPHESASVEETRERSWKPEKASRVVVESRVTLDLADYFLRVARDRFPFPASPQSTSMWDEAQRLTGLPVFRSIPDRTLPTAITYDEDRLDALEKVFGPSNAWPALTPQGALTAMPKEWPEPVGRIETVLEAPLEMRSENVYNRVVVEGKNPDTSGPVLRGIAEITDGFLRVRNRDGSRSPFGGNTYFYKSDFLTTQAQCQAYADELLPQVSRIRSVTRRLVEPFNPLRELGDVLVFADPTRGGEESLVRVRKIEHSGATTVTEVEVRT